MEVGVDQDGICSSNYIEIKSYVHLIVLDVSSSWPRQIDLFRKEFLMRKSF